MRPKILIPLALGDEPKESPRYFARTAYADAIEQAGGIAIFISRPQEEDLSQILPLMDGLLLMGGIDLHPKFYGEDVLPECGEVDEERDVLELALCKMALNARIPILGLCRGLQIMNIHFGGTLYQDLPTQFPSATKHESDATFERKRLMHKVEIIPDTILSEMVGNGPIEVNSIHHQGIKVLGHGLSVSARSPDGLIEGIEHPDFPFCVGTQWHPEEFVDGSGSGIFSRFVASTRSASRKEST